MAINYKRYIFTVSFLLVSLLGLSGNYALINIGTKGELKDNYVHCIYKDSDGFIWIGTGTTIERWDGIQSTEYPFPYDNLEYAPYLVNTILEKEPHEYWAGCKRGLWRLNLKSRKMEQFFPDQINFQVYHLAKDKENNLYIGTENGLYIYDGNEIRNIRVNPGNTPSGSNHVLGIELTENNNVWLMTPEGVAMCKPQSKVIRFYPNTLQGCGNLMSVARANRKLYIGTEKGGIITFDLSNHTFSPYRDNIQVPVSALSYENNLLAVATLGQGIQVFSLADNLLVYAGVYNPNVNTGLFSNRFSSVLLSEGNVWCGTDHYSGMSLLKKKQTTFSLYAAKGFNSEGIPIRSIFLSGKQAFVSNRDGFVCIKEGEEARYFNTKTVGKDKLRSDLIFSFYEYEGNILIGTYAGGVSVMNPQTYAFMETPLTRTLTKNDVFMFLEDKQNNLWIAASDGLYCYDKITKAVKEYNAFNSGMPGNIVYGIYIDSSDRFWVATNKGVTLFDRKTGTCSQERVPKENSMRNEPVRSIYEGKDGTLFFCLLSKVKALLVLDKDLKKFRYPLPMDCYNIIQDQNEYYWLATDLGVVKMNKEATHFSLFSSAEGLPDAPMAAGSNVVEDKEKQLWMASTKGLVIVNPNVAIHSSPLKITEVFVNGEQFIDTYLMQTGKPFSLKRNENNLVFRFVSLGYENPEEMKYEYILEGLDSAWIRLDHENKVAYYKLKPGSYTFKVRKLLNEDSMTEISIRIERGFSRIVYFILCLSLAGFIFTAWFIRNKKKHSSAIIPAEKHIPPVDNKDTLSESYVKLAKDEAEKMINELKAYMEKDKPYLNVDLKQSTVAMALGYSTYLLSALFTHYLKVGYYDFVNTYRIEEFKCRVKAGDHKKYTLLTLAEQCGFKSKTSFFRSFKKVTGLTPKEYIQKAR